MRPRFDFRSTFTIGWLALSLLGTGCETIGQGITEREFNTAWRALETGQTQAELFAVFGEPRERRSQPADTGLDEIWVYSQREIVGYKTEKSEGALSPSGGGIPTYEDVPIYEIVEYHLRWQDGQLVSWRRFE